jgi:hypothetical protein
MVVEGEFKYLFTPSKIRDVTILYAIEYTLMLLVLGFMDSQHHQLSKQSIIIKRGPKGV